MADKMQITIVGLGLIGTSAGLALHRYADKVLVVGHDRDSSAAGRARSMGAVDRTDWNLISAVRHADRILLALPVSEIKGTLAAFARDLKPNCVIVDTASVKEPVLAWAAELLPAEIALVGGHPVVVSEGQGTAAAKADLFQDKIFCLSTDARTTASALQVATDLVEALGAKPYFVDAAEHDGLAAAVEHLPALMAGALTRAVSESASWLEMRKVAGSQFYTSSFLVEGEAKGQAAVCLANQRNLVRLLDNLTAELDQWRQYLVSGDEEALTKAFEEAMLAAARWSRAQETGNWDVAPAPIEMPSAGDQFRRLFGLGGHDAKKQGHDDKKQAPKGK